MDQRNQWFAYKGRILIVVGITSLLSAMFLPAEFPQALTPFLVVFGVGFILMAIPARILKKLPEWFTRDDSWM